MPATIPIDFDDFQEWRKAHRLSQCELQKRAVASRRKNRAVVYLDQTQFHRWRRGALTPWRRRDCLYMIATNPLRSWPVLPEDLT